MGRLHYTNRKSDGLKLGQVIAKDLLKRIPPGVGSKAAIRDPTIELDVSGKALTAEGLAEVFTALEKSIGYHGTQGKVVRLEELCLRHVQLDITALPLLGRVISLAANDLRDLDLSENCIKVETDNETRIWEQFLASFSQCCLLRRIDLSNNELGPRAFEVLTRVYARENPLDLAVCDVVKEIADQDGDVLRHRFDEANPASEHHRNIEVETVLPPPDDQHGGSCHAHRQLERFKALPDHADPLTHCAATRGLRSVPYLILANTSMVEACAMYLSYIITSHNKPEVLLKYVPAAKAGSPLQQLLSYDNDSGCRGIVYLPNPLLGTVGAKVLHLAEALRNNPANGKKPEAGQEDSSFDRPENDSRRGSEVRRPSIVVDRRRSLVPSGSIDVEGHGDDGILSLELERARSRIQGNTLQDVGPRSNDLWWVALKMLILGRHIRPSPNKDQIVTRSKRPEEMRIPMRTGSSSQVLCSQSSSTVPLAPKNPNQSIAPNSGQWRLENSKLVPVSRSEAQSKKPSLLKSPRFSSLPTVPCRTSLPCGFPQDTWRRIIVMAAGAENILSETQQRSILSWAMDRQTLRRERESLGLKESAQIWKVLEATGCLAYEMKM